MTPSEPHVPPWKQERSNPYPGYAPPGPEDRAAVVPTIPLNEHLIALREAEVRFDTERDRRLAEVAAMNDRRLTEVAIEREKALKIKETADLAALQLAREIQTYKDEKANELRSQIERERGSYATKADLQGTADKVELAIKPLSDYVTGQQGRQEGREHTGLTADRVVAYIVGAGALVALIATNWPT